MGSDGMGTTLYDALFLSSDEILAKQKDMEEGDNGRKEKPFAGSKRKQRSEEVKSEGSDEEGTSSPREIVTRSRGRERAKDLTGQRRSKRGKK